MSGREFQAAMTTQPINRIVIELPYDSVTSTITPRDRIMDGASIQNIEAAWNELGNNEKIIVLLEEPIAC
jgi:hypothetical protein